MPICGTLERSSAVNGASDWGQAALQRIHQLRQNETGTVANALEIQLLGYDAENVEFAFSCKTYPWMRNLNDIVHGGFCAMVMDHAMGLVAYSIRPGEESSPTISLQVHYHRPLLPGKELLVKARVVSMTRRLTSLAAEAYHGDDPEKLCISATGTFFCKSAEK